jgi:molybdopterin-dependent oxidoreductase alpha subunit
MGIDEKPSEPFLARMDAALGFHSPREHGFDAVEAIHAMHRGDLDIFVALGGNFLSAMPDTAYAAEALQRCSWTAQISTKLNRSHLIGGRNKLILPCLGRTEIDRQTAGLQRVSVEDSMSCVHASHGHLEPASVQLLSEPMIVARMAQATLGDSPLPWIDLASDYRRIRSLIERAIPGFENYDARLDAPDGFVLPNTARQRRWNTASERAGFRLLPLPNLDQRPGELLMMTIRSHDQFNTTIYGLDDRYRGVTRGRMVLFANAADLAERGLLPGQKVTVAHERDGRRLAANGFTLVPYDLPRGNLAGYFPELNPIVPMNRVARNSGTPIYKSVPVTILRYEEPQTAAPNSPSEP